MEHYSLVSVGKLSNYGVVELFGYILVCIHPNIPKFFVYVLPTSVTLDRGRF